jgi:hypothetical protein
VRVVDERGRPAHARLRLRDASGTWRPIEVQGGSAVAAHPRFPELGVIVPERLRIALADGSWTLVVDRGTEYRIEETAVVGGRTPVVAVKLRRWVDAAARGWWSGDLHAHRAPEEMAALLEASDTWFAPAITRWNDRANVERWDPPLLRAAGRRAFSIDNSEDERVWGAALFFHLKSPIALYPSKFEWPPPSATWREARSRGAYIDQEKIIWWAAPVMAALMPPDSIGVLNNHFQEESLMANEAWGRPREQSRYPGDDGFTRYILDLYYTYLSAGFRIAASAGSANGVLRSPLGHNRSYVYLGGDFSVQAWLDGQKAGRNFVTNGPMLFVKVDGKPAGATLRAGEVNVQVEALSRAPLDRVEIVTDGRVAATIPAAGGDRLRTTRRVRAEEGGWLAVRCFGKPAGAIRFAHTGPFYIGAAPGRDPGALRFLRDWVDEYMRRVEALPETAMTSAQKREWLAECRRARERYQ